MKMETTPKCFHMGLIDRFGGEPITNTMNGLDHPQMLKKAFEHLGNCQRSHPLPQKVMDLRGICSRSPFMMIAGHPWIPGWIEVPGICQKKCRPFIPCNNPDCVQAGTVGGDVDQQSQHINFLDEMVMRPLCGICKQPNNPYSRLFAEEYRDTDGEIRYRTLPLCMYWYLEGLGAIVGINSQGCHPATVQSVAGVSGGRPFEVSEDGRIRPWYTIQREKAEYLAAQEEQQQQAKPALGTVLSYGEIRETLDESGLGPGLYIAPSYEWIGQQKPTYQGGNRIDKPIMPEGMTKLLHPPFNDPAIHKFTMSATGLHCAIKEVERPDRQFTSDDTALIGLIKQRRDRGFKSQLGGTKAESQNASITGPIDRDGTAYKQAMNELSEFRTTGLLDGITDVPVPENERDFLVKSLIRTGQSIIDGSNVASVVSIPMRVDQAPRIVLTGYCGEPIDRADRIIPAVEQVWTDLMTAATHRMRWETCLTDLYHKITAASVMTENWRTIEQAAAGNTTILAEEIKKYLAELGQSPPDADFYTECEKMQKASSEMSSNIETAAKAAVRGQKRALHAMNKQLGLKRKTDQDEGEVMSDDEPSEPGGTVSGTTVEGYELHNQAKKLRSPSPSNEFKIQTHRGPGAEAAPSSAADGRKAAPPGLPPISEHDGTAENETKEEEEEYVIAEAGTASNYGAAKAKPAVPNSAPYDANKDIS